MNETRLGRRAFFSVLGLGAIGLVAGGRITRALSPLGAAVPNGVANLVSNGGWRIYAINPPWPSFDRRRWTLEVTGEVEHPLKLSYDDLLALPSARQTTDFHCVTGWTVGDVGWQGVRLQDIWERARPTAQARYANFVSMEEPYVDTLSMDQTTLPNVMLAHAMDGKPLSRAHGAPLRLVIPEMYGYKNVKWLTRIELRPGFWERNGYDVDAWVGRSNGY
jgi:DMSO/TMAO reductase YedYZ molybdopterin-dependent catalytic subunit